MGKRNKGDWRLKGRIQKGGHVPPVKMLEAYFCLVCLLRDKHIGYVSGGLIQKQAKQSQGLLLNFIYTF